MLDSVTGKPGSVDPFCKFSVLARELLNEKLGVGTAVGV